jgi:hypothetical protein
VTYRIMALERAERILSQNTRTDEANLEGLGLTTIAPLLPMFAQMTRLRRLRLGRNALTSLPEDLSVLRNVETLDLAGNPIAGLSSVLRGLQCIPNLKHLHVDLPFESEEDEVIVTLSSLESFNGTSLTDADDAAAPPSGSTNPTKSIPQAWVNDSKLAPAAMSGSGVSAKTRWEESDTVQIQRLHQAVNSLSGRPASKQEFDDYTRSVVGHLNGIVSSEEDPLRREGEIYKSKKILFDYCFEEVVRAAQRADPALGQVLSLVQDSYSGLLNNYDRLVKNIVDTKEKKIEAMKIDLQGAIQEIEGLMQQLEAKGAQGSDGASMTRFDGERRKYTEEIGWLRTENEKLQTRIRQLELSRQGAPSASPSAGARALSGGSTFGVQSTDRSGQSPSRSTPPPLGSKVLTLRQLRDTIEDIYASKSKYDIKCAETHLPRETMEQHMYTYLNQRYGLKHIILEWATAIIQGIKKFSAEDNDIAVFGKILRNEVDEEFRFVQRQLKETVHELLRVYVKGKKPLKSDEEINQMVRKKVSGVILEEEWVDIVKYMYNNEDAVTIIMRIRDILKHQAQPRRTRRPVATSRSQAAKEEEVILLSYNEFIRILLDFQLEGHERFLSRFVRIFKQHDTDRNGIVNEQEFRAILRSVDPAKSEEDVSALLDLIDPHNNQLINFSECVTFLSAELVKMMRDEGP